MIRKIALTGIITMFYVFICHCQNKAISFNIYASNYLDRIKDKEYDYETVTDGYLTQFSFMFSHRLAQKLSYHIALGFSSGGGTYRNDQSMIGTGSTDERTSVIKKKKITYTKLGMGVTYWFNSFRKGPFVKSEFLIHRLISATSNDRIKFDGNDAQEFKVDFRTELKEIIPLLKLGVGYNLIIGKGISANVGLFLDIRTSSYYKETDDYNFLNRGLEFGIGYVFK